MSADADVRRSLALAQSVCDELRADPTDGKNIASIIVTGSVARGEIDQHSDVDCIIYLNKTPSETFFETQKRLATESGGGVYGGDPDQGFGVYRVIDGIKVDLGIGPVAGTNRIIEDVLERQDLELDKQLIIGGIRTGIVLHGRNIIDRWVAQTDTYPDALAIAMIEHHLRIRPIWVLRGMGADRDDRLFLSDEILATQRQIFGVLCGLNRVWHPGKLKGSRHIFDTFTLAPPGCLERMSTMLNTSLHAAVDDLERMVNEVFDLVETDGPSGVDVSARRSYFGLDLSRRFDQA